MVAGFFAKVKNFFSDVGDGIKQAFSKGRDFIKSVLPVAKPIMNTITPMLKMAPHPAAQGIGTGLEWANKFLDHL